MVRDARNRKRRPFAGLVGLALLIAAPVQAQVRAELSPKSLAVGEQMTYVIRIDYEEPEDVVLPRISFPGLRLLEGPNIRPATRVSTDQRSRIVEVRMVFEAVSAGRYILDPLYIDVAGQLFETPAQVVEIGLQGERDKVPFLARWVVPDRPLLEGESTAVVLEIFNVDEFIYPTDIQVEVPAQAIFEEVQGLGRNSTIRIDGVELFEIPVAVFMLTPPSAGTVSLRPATVSWAGLEAKTQDATITVLEAPDSISASGAVGQFALSSDVSAARIAATETIEFTLRIEGSGNMHFLNLPEVTLDGFLLDSQTRTERLEPAMNGYSGFVEARLIARPTGSGNGRIVVDQFAYHDPVRGTVRTTQLPAIDVEITELKQPAGSAEDRVAFVLLDADELAAVDPANWFRNPAAYALFAPGLLLMIGLRLWRRRSSGPTLVAVAALLLLGAAPADYPVDDIDRALSAYENGDLAGSVHAFESALRRAPFSPGINHNLSILYFQAGDIGRSVYAAREAVRLNPGPAAVRTNLEVIEDAASLDRSVAVPHVIHPDVLFAALAAAVNIFFCLLAFSGGRRRERRAGVLAISRILMAAVVATLAVGFAIAVTAQERQVGVILSDVSLRRIPSENAESWLDIRAGTAVDMVAEKDGFILVQTDLELQGWVRLTDLLYPSNPALPILRYRAFAM